MVEIPLIIRLFYNSYTSYSIWTKSLDFKMVASNNNILSVMDGIVNIY